MRYIIKNGRIYGIYSNNYQNLTGKPLINNVELAEGRSYSSSDLNIIKHMTKAEYDALTTKNPNCYYVVSTETVADISNFDYLNIDNKPSINNVTLTGNKSLLDLNLYSIDEIDNKIASSRSVKVQTTKPTSADVLANTLYYIGPDSNSKYHVYLYDSNKVEADLGMSDVDLTEYVKKTDITTTINSSSTDLQVPSAKAVFDKFAPINAVIGVNNNASFTNPNDCVFNFTSTYSRILEPKRFTDLRMTDLITNQTMFGSIDTEQIYCGSYIIINQTFYCYYENNKGKIFNSPITFKRIGYIDSTDTLDKNLYDNRANITWKSWYPVDYPTVTIQTASLNTSVVTYGNIAYKITGGVLTINLNYLRFATAGQNGQVITTNSNFSWISSAIAKLNCQCVIHGWKTTVAPTSGFATISVSSKNITVYDVQADNKEYYGQLIVPLGY